MLDRYFKKTYDELNSSFEEGIKAIQKLFLNTSIYNFQYDQGVIKSFFWPTAKPANNLLIVCSGTHGIEGLTGSAIQRWMMDQNFIKERTNSDILFIHGFNIFGFKNYRRVNENNVDLNRNFILNREEYKSDDSLHKDLYNMLNPSGIFSFNFKSKLKYLALVIKAILLFGVEKVRKSVLLGQYTFPNGIFYGGKELAIQHKLIHELIEKYIDSKYEKIILVDLHTGYGQKNKLHLFAGDENELQNNQVLENIFGNNQIDFGSKDDFYIMSGEMIKYFHHYVREKLQKENVQVETVDIVFEFGTIGTQTVFQSAEALRRMIVENQNYHAMQTMHNPETIQAYIQAQRDFIDLFYPDNEEWRQSVVDQSELRFKQIFDWFEK